MTGWPDIDPTDAEAVAERRDEVVAAVRDHAGQIAYALARLQGGDYGQRDFDTDRGTWTVKYEAGDLEYLRYDPRSGSEVYVVSTKQPPEPEPLATALTDYDAFVAAFDDHVASLDGVLDEAPTDFPAPASVDGVVAERDRVVGSIRDTCDAIARALARYEGGDYGTFATRVDGTRWELKYDEDGTSYLRVGGEGGVYLISQYEPPAAPDLREYAPRFSGFVDAYNEYVADLESDLATVSL
ncbi:hypothetical protein [Halorientalis sp. IM1011]|uniref:hypothetical protein n=1 Tax=Halorientalis sp. IM1011 TaxID=1932360 RepID=UPI0015602F1C|nr:hypothetical protein [Halorientalis sp. IM1011]